MPTVVSPTCLPRYYAGKTGLTSSALRACYLAVALYVAGFVLQGAAFQMHLHIAVLVVGWILAEVAVMLNTSAVCES